MPFNPIVIDANGSPNGNATNPAYGVFAALNQLFILNAENDGSISVWNSSNGNSWAQTDASDPARPLSVQTATAVVAGTQTLIVAWVESGQVTLQAYNLSLKKWGSTIASTATTAIFACAVFLLPDNITYRFLYGYSSAGDAQTGSGFGMQTWDGTSWSAIDAGANITTIPGWDPTLTSVTRNAIFYTMDSATGRLLGTVKTESFDSPPPILDNLYFYQAIEPNGTLGTFFMFPGQQPASGPQDLTTSTGAPANGRPVIVGSQIVIPVIRTIPTNTGFQYPTLYIGSPLATPSFNLLVESTGIDPASLTDFANAPNWIALTTDGSNVLASWEYWLSGNDTDSAIRISQASVSDLSTWVASTAWTPPGPNGLGTFPILRAFSGQQLLSSGVEFTGTIDGSVWFGNFTPAPPPGGASPTIINQLGLPVIILPNPAANRCKT